jgi:DNA helicase-2/ATP-dependent DNA helicase PcrA
MTIEWLASRRWPNLRGAESPEFSRDGAAWFFVRHAASERMDLLLKHVREQANSGTPSQEMLVVCADPSSASRLRGKLRASECQNARDVRVTTCRELACSIIGQPRDADKTDPVFGSGEVRILSAYETDFVIEDLKTLGTRPKRLRELLKFLYRGWTELSDEDPDWLFTVEEIDTFEFLSEELAYLGAVMEPQISNLATKALRLNPDMSARFNRRHLFVLDYQNLSRASQLLCQLLAVESLTVVADDAGCVEVYESYPYLKGVEEFSHYNHAAHIENAAELAANRAIGRQANAVSNSPERVERSFEMPKEEIEAMADEIAAAAKKTIDPSDIGVIALHPLWARRMGRALEARGVPVDVWYEPLELRGDVRDLERCLALRIVTLLRLISNSHDGVAYRSWFGFGDYLARSNLFSDMRKAQQTLEYPGDVRRDLGAFGFDLASDLDPLLSWAKTLRGTDLIDCLLKTLAGSGIPLPASLRFIQDLGHDASAGQIVAEIDRRQFFSGIPRKKGVVVSSYKAMAGLDFAQLYVIGFVNGLFPSSAFFDLTKVSIAKQEKMREQDTRTAHVIASLGRERICVSHFSCAEHDFAERVGLKQLRIFAADDDGNQLCEIEPSIYTDVLMGRA